MDAATTELLGGLREAMQAERAGEQFYRMAAAGTADPTAREVFLHLAGEEAQHFEFLAAQYRSLQARGVLDESARLGRGADLGGDSPIFSPELRRRIGQAHFEMSALAIAVQLEQNGIDHYRRMAEKAVQPEAKAFFRSLVEWETAHHDAFVRQQRALQQEYWEASGFAPF